MPRPFPHPRMTLAVCALVGAGLAVNAPSAGGQEAGVSATEITVGAIGALTGPTRVHRDAGPRRHDARVQRDQ